MERSQPPTSRSITSSLKSSITVFTLSLALIGLAVFTHNAFAMNEGKSKPKSKRPAIIEIQGTGKVSKAPDMAHLTAGVVSTAKTAKEALSKNNSAMSQTFALLKAYNIDKKDVQTSNFNVSPQYQHFRDGRPRQVKGYQVSNTVRIKLRNLDQLGGLMDDLVSAGSNQIRGVQFTFADAGPLKDKARELAIQDARRKAELYAKAAGVTLGKIRRISETISSRPGPRPMTRMAMAESPSAVPIASGENTISAQIYISWEIIQ